MPLLKLQAAQGNNFVVGGCVVGESGGGCVTCARRNLPTATEISILSTKVVCNYCQGHRPFGKGDSGVTRALLEGRCSSGARSSSTAVSASSISSALSSASLSALDRKSVSLSEFPSCLPGESCRSTPLVACFV